MPQLQTQVSACRVDFFEPLAQFVALQRQDNIVEFKFRAVHAVLNQEVSILHLRRASVDHSDRETLLSDVQSDLGRLTDHIPRGGLHIDLDQCFVVGDGSARADCVEVLQLLVQDEGVLLAEDEGSLV